MQIVFVFRAMSRFRLRDIDTTRDCKSSSFSSPQRRRRKQQLHKQLALCARFIRRANKHSKVLCMRLHDAIVTGCTHTRTYTLYAAVSTNALKTSAVCMIASQLICLLRSILSSLCAFACVHVNDNDDDAACFCHRGVTRATGAQFRCHKLMACARACLQRTCRRRLFKSAHRRRHVQSGVGVVVVVVLPSLSRVRACFAGRYRNGLRTRCASICISLGRARARTSAR